MDICDRIHQLILSDFSVQMDKNQRKKVFWYILATLGVGIGGFFGTPLFVSAVHLSGHNETLTPGTYTYGNLTISTGSTLTLQGNCATNTGVTINANNITVNSGGTISANGQEGEKGSGTFFD